jgi:ankyrin repeat protein
LIHAATKYNNLEVVRELLNRGAYIDSKTIFNESPLIIAINNNNVDIVNLLLERNVKIDGNVFYSVIKNNNIDLLRFILDKKDYDVNTKEGYFDTLLNYAIINNKPEIVIELIRRGADVNLEKFGLSPLQHSIDNNNLKILNILIDNNVKCTLNILYDSFKYHISSFILLLNRISSLNIDINMISITYDDTLLHMAIKKNNIEIVKLLLEKGADPNIKNRAEQTPLEIAIFNYNIEIVKLLLEKGADPNIKNRAKQTSLEIAILINNIEIVKLLLEKGADPNIKNRDGQTLLEIAQYKDYDIIVNLLLEKGARGEIKIKSPYSTEIVEAVRKQNIELVKELLDKGADVNTIDKDNYGKRSLLHIATDKKNKDMINLLLDRGANIDIFDNNKETALHLAIGLKNIDIIYLLLKRGANIDIPKEKSARYIGLGILSRDIATMLSGGGLNQSSDFKNKYFKNKYLKYKTKYLQLKEKI